MSYTILEIHAKYQAGALTELAVMWVSNEKLGLVRASYANTEQTLGYAYLWAEDTLSEELCQEVAGTGMNLPDNLKKKFFPGKHKWEQ